MKRRLLNLLTALSLLVCVALAALGVRSYFVSDVVRHVRSFARADSSGVTEWIARPNRGRVTVHHLSFRAVGGNELQFPNRRLWNWTRYAPERRGAPHSLLGRLGISWTWQRHYPPDALRSRSVTLPLWLLTALFATAPAVRICRRLRRTHAAGLCPSCGYDLRASTRRCPECGTVP